MPHVPRNIQGGFTATDFWNQWNSTTPRMALFILITPQSFWSSVSPIGITSNSRDMTLPGHAGVTFRSAPGITPTLVEQILDEPTNLEMTGIYQTGAIEHADVKAGKWNFATIEVFCASWQNTSLGELVIAKCKTGEIKDYQTYFVAEGRGYLNLLSNDVNKETSRFCRVKEFRDAECGHTASTVTIDAVVYEVTQTALLLAAGNGRPEVEFFTATFNGNAPPVNLFTNGKITATNGANNGVSREIAKQLADNDGIIQIVLKRAFPFDFVEGVSTFNLVAGCNRTIEDCMKFSNIVNRRAEDWIPTIEAANKVPPSS